MRRHLRIKSTHQFKYFLSTFQHNPEEGMAVHSLDFLGWKGQGRSSLDIVRLISRCPNLRTLRVQGVHFAKTYALPEFYFNTQYLTSLDLGWGYYVSEAALSVIFRGAPNLRVLAIQGLHSPWTWVDPHAEEPTPVEPPFCRLEAMVAYEIQTADEFLWTLSSSKDSLKFFSLMGGLTLAGVEDGNKRLAHLFKDHLQNIVQLSIRELPRFPVAEYCSKLEQLRVFLAIADLYRWTWVNIESQLQESLQALSHPLRSLIFQLPSDRTDTYIPFVEGLIQNVPCLSELEHLGFEMQVDRIRYSVEMRKALKKLITLCDTRNIQFNYPMPDDVQSSDSDDDSDYESKVRGVILTHSKLFLVVNRSTHPTFFSFYSYSQPQPILP
jgi:hypothetical protein